MLLVTVLLDVVLFVKLIVEDAALNVKPVTVVKSTTVPVPVTDITDVPHVIARVLAAEPKNAEHVIAKLLVLNVP